MVVNTCAREQLHNCVLNNDTNATATTLTDLQPQINSRSTHALRPPNNVNSDGFKSFAALIPSYTGELSVKCKSEWLTRVSLHVASVDKHQEQLRALENRAKDEKNKQLN
jgi:hypothetical protein